MGLDGFASLGNSGTNSVGSFENLMKLGAGGGSGGSPASGTKTSTPEDKRRKRWSVCGGEKRADLELETIWEDKVVAVQSPPQQCVGIVSIGGHTLWMEENRSGGGGDADLI